MEDGGFNLREDKLTRGVLVLAISLSEVIKDALKLQTLHQIKNNGMSEEDMERWRGVLMELDAALDQIREDDCVARGLHQLGHDLSKVVDHILSTALNPDPVNWSYPDVKHGDASVRTRTK